MGAICTLLNQAVSRRSGVTNPAQWLIDIFAGGDESASGVKVSHDSALKHTPFWSSVRIISGTLAALPFLVYERTEDGGGKDRVPAHPIYKLLHDRPNEYMDSLTLIETRQAHALCYGNGYCEIQRDGAGRPVALWPLMPQPERTKRVVDKQGRLYYEIRTPDGQGHILPDENVLHIKGLGFDGYTGYDVVRYHKEAIGYGVAVKEFGARFFGNGANVGGVIEHPTTLGDKAMKHLKESMKTEYEGLSKAHRLMILEEGMKLNKTGVEPDKAQALEVLKWTVDDCSRIFQIPPHKLGSMEFSKYNNVEQLQLDFIATTMLYWFKKWEQECNYKLFGQAERGRYFCEILVEGLLRGDIKSRTESLAMQKDRGVLSRNEWRAIENRNPVEGGDEFTEAANIAGNQNNGNQNNGNGNNNAVRAAHRQ